MSGLYIGIVLAFTLATFWIGHSLKWAVKWLRAIAVELAILNRDKEMDAHDNRTT